MKNSGSKRLGRPPLSESKTPITDKILYATNKLFLERGFENVSMDEIAKACGVTKASVYYYYPTKAELVAAALLSMMENIRKATYGILQKPVSLKARLLEITTIHLRVTSFNFETVMRKLEVILTKEQMVAMRKAEEAIALTLADEFKKSGDAGEIGHIDPLIASHAYLNLLMLGQSKNANGTSLFSSKEEAAQQVISLLWYGLFPQ